MQHFEIMEWEDNGTEGFVKFKGGLESKRENGYNNMYQDGKLIASTAQDTINDRGIGKTTLFLPWTWEQLGEQPENKVYGTHMEEKQLGIFQQDGKEQKVLSYTSYQI